MKNFLSILGKILLSILCIPFALLVGLVRGILVVLCTPVAYILCMWDDDFNPYS